MRNTFRASRHGSRMWTCQRHRSADVRTLHLAWNEPRPALLDRSVDAAVARRPFPTDRLQVTALYDEPRVLLVSRDHRLAGRQSVTFDDIAGEPVPREPDPTWSAFWRVDPRPDGKPAPDGPLVDALEDKVGAHRQRPGCGHRVGWLARRQSPPGSD